MSLLDRLRAPWIIFFIMDALYSEATNLNLHSINRTFVFRGQPVFTTQPINPAWRPCYRRAPETPIVSTVMRKVHGITFHFLNYLWRAGVRGQPAPVMARPPEPPPNKSLDHEFILILKGYVESQGLPTKKALPDVCTLTESRRWKGMTISGIQALIRRHRAAIADAARNDEALLGATEIAKKLAQLTFSQVRRSARANRQLACKNQDS
ncbi:hypothetical protein F475_01053 [Pseudomonas sp. URMO17WK12:I6]|uniref:hypothetical protein n=1 Tax=Pseudomonas sp. URMO17WK12:I6 TaxID=1261629 RepID=UPI000DB5690D|nr:hypothetical protein [Pseudomonas sp. URMO17WK12:I6]PZW64979.1 hypothetical protein F475_01053 [Pseudomonas sp. URMO17WK12:I6]